MVNKREERLKQAIKQKINQNTKRGRLQQSIISKTDASHLHKIKDRIDQIYDLWKEISTDVKEWEGANFDYRFIEVIGNLMYHTDEVIERLIDNNEDLGGE